MPRLLDKLRTDQRSIVSIDDYVAALNQTSMFGGALETTIGGPAESIGSTFREFGGAAFHGNGVVFSVMAVRQYVFSAVRFRYQRLRDGKPSDMFGTPDLSILETPWIGGTTQDLLSRMIQDADLAGSSFQVLDTPLTRMGGDGGQEIVRLRPDWVDVVIERRMRRSGFSETPPGQLGYRKVGYLYTEGGRHSGHDPVPLLLDEVAHFMPMPDPLATFRGMSWLTPVVREIENDALMTRHKRKFFENGATPNMIIKHEKGADRESIIAFNKRLVAENGGVENAYKNLNLYPGADATVVGVDMQKIDFRQVQGAGEPLGVDTPIPTPKGWTTMGDIEPGDQVIGRDGLPANVVAVSPIHHDRKCYRVTFNDRTSIVADGGHIWAALDRTVKGRPEQTYTTEQLRDRIVKWEAKGNGGNRMGIAPMAAVKAPARDLLVDPYVLGAWLGDGQTAGAAICGADADLAFIASEIERRGYTTTEWTTAPDKVSVIGIPGGLLSALRALGVLGNKHIPSDYLRASIEQRLDLLRGLMDTDGSVGHAGKETCEFSSKFESLARQVAELARSLGYRCTVSSKRDMRSRTGMTWRVTFRADPDMVPFALPRKAARCVTPLHVRNRAIVSIEPVATVPVRCIAVDSPDHLFVAGEGWVLTHNTRIAAAGGTPPVIVGLSEGLAAATYSNYAQARRRFGDGTIHPLWQNAAGSLSPLLKNLGKDTRLWYDADDIPFLREDEKDSAEINKIRAETISSLITAGYEPDSVVTAVDSGDFRILRHTGLYSVQLQKPGATAPKGEVTV